MEWVLDHSQRGTPVAASLNEELLDERLAKLEMARSWSPRLVSKLESYVRSADDEALFRINPFTLARERNLPEDEVIDLLLNATSLGLFAWIGYWSVRNALASSKASAASKGSTTTITAACARSATKRRSTTISLSPSP
jgi:hypothetical protein